MSVERHRDRDGEVFRERHRQRRTDIHVAHIEAYPARVREGTINESSALRVNVEAEPLSERYVPFQLSAPTSQIEESGAG
jgi:hypothetical protein